MKKLIVGLIAPLVVVAGIWAACSFDNAEMWLKKPEAAGKNCPANRENAYDLVVRARSLREARIAVRVAEQYVHDYYGGSLQNAIDRGGEKNKFLKRIPALHVLAAHDISPVEIAPVKEVPVSIPQALEEKKDKQVEEVSQGDVSDTVKLLPLLPRRPRGDVRRRPSSQKPPVSIPQALEEKKDEQVQEVSKGDLSDTVKSLPLLPRRPRGDVRRRLPTKKYPFFIPRTPEEKKDAEKLDALEQEAEAAEAAQKKKAKKKVRFADQPELIVRPEDFRSIRAHALLAEGYEKNALKAALEVKKIYQEQIKELEMDIAHLQAQIASSTSPAEALSLQKELAFVQEKLKRAEDTLQAYAERQQLAEERARDAEEKLAHEVESKQSQIDAQLAPLREELKKSNEKLIQAEKDFAKKLKDIAHNARLAGDDQKAKFADQAARHASELARARADSDALQSSINQLKGQQRNLEAQLAGRKQEVNDLQAALANARYNEQQSILNLQNQIDQLGRRLTPEQADWLHDQLQLAEQQALQARTGYNALNLQLQTTTRDLDAANEQVRNLEQQLRDLQNQRAQAAGAEAIRLQSQIDALNGQLQQAHVERDMANTANTNLQARLGELQAQFDESQRQVADLSTQLAAESGRVVGLQAQLATVTRGRDELQGRFAISQNELVQAQADADRANTLLSDRDNEIEGLRWAIEGLRKDLALGVSDLGARDKLQKQLDEQEKALKRAQTARDKAKQESAAANQKIERFTAQLAQVRGELAASQAEVARLTQQLADEAQQHAIAQAHLLEQLATQQVTNAALAAQLEDANRRANDAGGQLAASGARVGELEGQLKTQETQIQQLRDKLTQVGNTAEENARLQKELTEAQKTNVQLQSDLDALQRKMQALSEELDAARGEVGALSKELSEQASKHLQAIEGMQRQFETWSASANEENQKLIDQIKMDIATLEGSNKNIAELKAVIVEKNKELDVLRVENAKLHGQIDGLQQQNRQVVEKNAELQVKLGNLTQQLGGYQKIIEQQQEQIATLGDENRRLTSQMAELTVQQDLAQAAQQAPVAGVSEEQWTAVTRMYVLNQIKSNLSTQEWGPKVEGATTDVEAMGYIKTVNNAFGANLQLPPKVIKLIEDQLHGQKINLDAIVPNVIDVEGIDNVESKKKKVYDTIENIAILFSGVPKLAEPEPAAPLAGEPEPAQLAAAPLVGDPAPAKLKTVVVDLAKLKASLNSDKNFFPVPVRDQKMVEQFQYRMNQDGEIWYIDSTTEDQGKMYALMRPLYFAQGVLTIDGNAELKNIDAGTIQSQYVLLNPKRGEGDNYLDSWTEQRIFFSDEKGGRMVPRKWLVEQAVTGGPTKKSAKK